MWWFGASPRRAAPKGQTPSSPAQHRREELPSYTGSSSASATHDLVRLPDVDREPVTAIYTAEVHTVTLETSLEDVKNRMDELETERAHLTDYITGTR